jgi:predicted ATPase/class 3 adenylate cyclase
MKDYPTGTITFLLTDIEGSTELWERYPDAMRLVTSRHDEIIEKSVELHHGMVVRPRGEGDSRFAVFSQVDDGVQSAVDILEKLAEGFSDLPFALKVRIGMHTGTADLRLGDYYGSTVNRCARIRALGHGGQLLLSQVTAEIVRDDLPQGTSLIDMGTHQLKGFSRGERIFQLSIPGLPNEFPPLNSAHSNISHLPTQLTPFIGRAAQIAAVKDLILNPGVRLITLLGPGGTGKTRLSLQVAQEVLENFLEGAFFVPLAEDTDSGQLISRIAQQLEVRDGGRPLLETIIDYLRDKRVLLILDNFEQLVAASPVISNLLAAAPQVKILVSSRIALNVRGEHEFPVPPLELPSSAGEIILDQLAENESVRLFVERATAAQPSFALTNDNASAVAEICRHLDGLPLAIELAAARVKILPPQAILARLGDRLKLLSGGARDLPARHQTLRNALEWSYSLLKPAQKSFYARLSVFTGGCTLEAAEAVCNLDGNLDILEELSRLVDNSLLRQVEMGEGEPRFIMLETIRAFALEKLVESGEAAMLQERHARYFGKLIIDRAGHELYSANALYWLNWLEGELDNVRATLDWSLSSPGGADFAAGLVWSLLWFCYRRGYSSEGRTWTAQVLSLPAIQADPSSRALVLITDGMLSLWVGEQEAGLAYLQDGLAIEQRLENEPMLAPLLLGNGVALINMGRDREARPFLEQAQALFDQYHQAYFKFFTMVHLGNVELGLGNPDKARILIEEAYTQARAYNESWILSFALNNLGEIARVQGQYEQARSYYQDCEAILEDTGDRGDLARFAHSLGYIAQYEGNLIRAETQFRKSLAMFRKLGNRRGIAECMAGLAGLRARQGQPNWGAVMLSTAETILKGTGGVWWPADRVEVERSQAIIRSTLSDAEFAAAQVEGQAMTLEQGLTFVSENP